MPITLTGAQVRELRQASGVSQAELARQLGYSRYAISYWERHPDRSIPLTQYERVLAALARLGTPTERARETLRSLAVAWGVWPPSAA